MACIMKHSNLFIFNNVFTYIFILLIPLFNFVCLHHLSIYCELLLKNILYAFVLLY